MAAQVVVSKPRVDGTTTRETRDLAERLRFPRSSHFPNLVLSLAAQHSIGHLDCRLLVNLG